MLLRRWPAVFAVVSFTTFTTCMPSPVAGAVRTKTLQVHDLTTRTVEVRLKRRGPAGSRAGRIALLVRNRSGSPRRIRVRYTSADGDSRFAVRAVGRSAHRTRRGALTRSRGLAIPVAARELVDLDVRF